MSAQPFAVLRHFAGTRARIATLAALLCAALVAGLAFWTPWQHEAASSGTPKASGPLTADEAMRKAQAQEREVVVEAETTPTSRTFALPNGTWRSEINAVPVRTEQPDGTWAPIDAGLRRSKDGTRLRPKNTPGHVEFAAAPTGRTASSASPATAQRVSRSHHAARTALWRPAAGAQPAVRAGSDDVVRAVQERESFLASATYGEHTITYSWPGALPDPVVDGNRALYREVMPGVDLLLVAREDGGFGQLLIVKNEQAARQDALRTVSYKLSSDTAAFTLDDTTGGVTITNAADGKPVGAIPTPFAWDSNGLENPEDSAAKPYTDTTTARTTLALTGLTGPEPGSVTAQLPAALDGGGTRQATLNLDAAATGLLTGKQVDAGKVRFPVFIDPTLELGDKGWTIAYKPYPNSNYFNGTNYNGGTSEARVGYESQDGGLARSFWRMSFPSAAHDSTVLSANWKIKNTHAWSCSEPRQIELWLTGGISTSTTWKNQPSWARKLDAKSYAHGNEKFGCNDAYVGYNVKSGAQDGATKKWGSITLGLRATTETSTYTWRKYSASSALFTITFNRKPQQPVNGDITPGECNTVVGEEVIGLTDVVLKATATDYDNNLKGLRFRLWETGASTKILDKVITGTGGSKTQTASVTVASTKLADAKTYSWDVRAEDTEGAVSTFWPPGNQPCRFTVDNTAPAAPTMTSEDFPRANAAGSNWAVNAPHGTSGNVTLDSGDSTTGYVIGFNSGNFTYIYLDDPATGQTFRIDRDAATGHLIESVTRASKGQPITITLKAPMAGPVYLKGYARDAVGNFSQASEIKTYVPSGRAADAPGDVTGDTYPDLVGLWSTGSLWTYPGEDGGELFTNMAASYNGKGEQSPSGHFYDANSTATSKKHALISKWDDFYPGDGLTDLLARTPDGKLWIYQGDGYGGVNVDERVRVLLPDNAPDPATWGEMRTSGDVTGDGEPDLMIVTDGGQLWFLGGYTAGAFTDAIRLTSDSGWSTRDVLAVADFDLDKTPDLLWRNLTSGKIYLRHGKPGAAGEGSVDPVSLALGANSRDGADAEFGTGWTEAAINHIVVIPDTSGDGIPDIWARETATGKIRLYHPSKTSTNAFVKIVWNGDMNAFFTFT
ncbi:FG-GAP-like repeat-containing protein [Streptomyces sp. NPDC090029]|uniref:FG-GAP-like repeat-containing protein n=1 Tax=Streptomyces sp. NPDC090029 TaxID=3365924 RepID=UPI003813911A